MAKPHQLKEVERSLGEPLDRTLLGMVNAYGQLGAAKRLGVSQSTISRWLRLNGFTKVTKWEKAG